MVVNQNILMKGANIIVKNLCTIKQPTLDDIFVLPDNKYEIFLNVLHTELQDYIDAMDGTNSDTYYNPYIKMLSEKLSLCQMLLINEQTRELVLQALSFFICEPVEFDTQNFGITINGKLITEDDYATIKHIIMSINGVPSTPPTPTMNFTSKKAREIYEKCQAGKRKRERAKHKADPALITKMKLDNIVGYVASHSNSYNLTNIWQLTIYQLYDQFKRLNLYTQLDTVTKRWATWGKDDFDFSVYFDNVNNLK